MELRQRVLNGTDRITAVVLVTLVSGTVLVFGGRVWWAPLAIAGLCSVLVLLGLVQMLLQGSVRLLRSPLTSLGVLALLLAAVQLAPLPGTASERLSPSSRAAYAVGFLPERARVLDPEIELPETPLIRSPISIDRSATVRWLAGGVACLAVFWTAARYADRLGRLYVVWGSVVGAFFINTALAVVQVTCGVKGLFGSIEPGRGPIWAPSLDDLLTAPGSSVLRAAGAESAGHPAWALAVPDRPALLGSQMGGPGAYLALASIGLPLALALTLQLLSPRGSREPLSLRLAESSKGSVVSLVYGMLLASAALVGFLAGPLCSLAFALALAFAGFPGARATGLRWSAVGLTLLALLALGSGAAAAEVLSRSLDEPPTFVPEHPGQDARIWSDALAITRDFPALGTGLGTFPTVFPYYKTQDASPTTAASSLLQWWVETGYVGLGLVAVAALWCLARLPGALRAVGTADCALAFGLIGTAIGFTLLSTVHWTIELSSVALAASAVGGTWNRWLAGGTDLFVERG
jgi:hypothetical protein